MIKDRSATSTTPEVRFEAATGTLSLRGEAYPENVTDFYEPLMAEISAYLAGAESFRLIFRLTYFNTSSAKYFFDLLALLDDARKRGCDVAVEWHYQENVEIMREHGEGFADEFDVPVTFVADL